MWLQSVYCGPADHSSDNLQQHQSTLSTTADQYVSGAKAESDTEQGAADTMTKQIERV